MDSRFPTHFLNDRRVRRATAEQFRFFVMATAWAVSNMTDGHISTEDLFLIPNATEDLPGAMVRLELWSVNDAGWFIVDYPKTQTPAAQIEGLEQRKANDRERQRRKRARDAAPESHGTPERDLSRDDKGKARQGKAEERQGQALEHEVPQTVEAVASKLPSNVRSFPECSTLECDGRLNQGQMDRGSSVCANCARLSRQPNEQGILGGYRG